MRKQLDRFGFDLDLFQADHLHAHLLGQRQSQLVFCKQTHLHSDLAKLLAWIALLLIKEHFKLIVIDKTEIDQNLSNASNRH